MKTTNYETLTLQSLRIIPSNEHFTNYKSDYREMQSSMIHGYSLDFDALIEKITDALK